jgi:hypothetical protein
MKQAIRNVSFSALVESAQIPCPCDISKYVLTLIGTAADGIRYSWEIRILACAKIPFHGPHYVSVASGEPFWVQSLTCFKKNFFPIVDRLSFERAIYLKIHSSLFRLKNIRFVAVLPIVSIPVGTPVFRSPTLYVYELSVRQASLSGRNKTRNQLLNHHVEALLIVYRRDFPDIQTCCEQLITDFTALCRRITATVDYETLCTELFENYHAEIFAALEPTMPKTVVDINVA